MDDNFQELKDFIKELAVELNKNNVDEYKKRAAALVMDINSLSSEELAHMINSAKTYDEALELFNGDKKMLNAAVKKMMTETEYFLAIYKEYYMKNKKCFSWLNKITKMWISNPMYVPIEDMTDIVLTYWLDNPESKIYKDNSTLNPFFKVLETKNKKLIVKVINHKNFKLIPSHYPLVELLTRDDYVFLLTKKIFDKVFNILMKIIDSDFSEELAPIIRLPYLEMKHFDMISTEQEIEMYEYAKQNNIRWSNRC